MNLFNYTGGIHSIVMDWFMSNLRSKLLFDSVWHWGNFVSWACCLNYSSEALRWNSRQNHSIFSFQSKHFKAPAVHTGQVCDLLPVPGLHDADNDVLHSKPFFFLFLQAWTDSWTSAAFRNTHWNWQKHVSWLLRSCVYTVQLALVFMVNSEKPFGRNSQARQERILWGPF